MVHSASSLASRTTESQSTKIAPVCTISRCGGKEEEEEEEEEERDEGGGDGGGRRGGFDDRGGRTESMNTHNIITSTTTDMLMASDEAQGVDDPLEAARLAHLHHVDEEMGDLMRQEGGDGGGGRGGVEVVEGRVEEGEIQLFDGDAEDLQDLSGQRKES